MKFAIPAWMFNIWFRRAVLALVLFAAYEGWKYHERGIGKTQGITQESQQNQQAQQGSVKADRDTVTPQLQVLTQQITVLAQVTAGLQAQVSNLKSQQLAAQQQVAGMSPEQVQNYINQALGRPQNSTQPYTADDSRRIADCFARANYCEQITAKQDEAIRSLRDEQLKQNTRYLLLGGYTTRVERAYTDLYNDKLLPKRKAWCFWLCKRKDRIEAPDPKSLFSDRPINKAGEGSDVNPVTP